MKKILIVENNDDMQRYLELVASRFGYASVLARSSSEADEALGRAAFDFAVLSRSAYGADFDKGLKAVVGAVGGAKVIVICNEGFTDVARLADSQGVRACLTTPFEIVFVTDILDEQNTISSAATGEGERFAGADGGMQHDD